MYSCTQFFTDYMDRFGWSVGVRADRVRGMRGRGKRDRQERNGRGGVSGRICEKGSRAKESDI